MPQLHGEIHHISDAKQIGDNFTKRDIIVVVDKMTQYPQYITIQFTNAKCANLDPFKAGQQVSIDYNLQGRLDKQDNTKAYNQLQGWKIEKV